MAPVGRTLPARLLNKVAGFVDRVFGSTREIVGETDFGGSGSYEDFLRLFSGVHDPYGFGITDKKAMKLAAVYRCMSLLSGILASMPVSIHRWTNADRTQSEEIFDHPAYEIMNVTPDRNTMMTPSVCWREFMEQSRMGVGVGYSELTVNGRNQAVNAFWLPRGWITPHLDYDTGKLYYHINSDGRRRIRRRSDNVLSADQILRIGNKSLDGGVTWLSTLGCAAQEINLGLGALKHQDSFFKRGVPLGFLKPDRMLDDEEMEQVQESWEEMHNPDNNFNIGILPNMEFQKFSMTAKECQFIETRVDSVFQIAMYFGVPPHMLGRVGESGGGYNSVEHLMIEFVNLTLLPLVRQWENECRLKLFTRDESRRYYVKFDIQSLLMGDAKSRAESMEKELRNGVLLINEWRRLNGRNPVEDGDKPLVIGSQLATLESVIDGTANLDTTNKSGGKSPSPAGGSNQSIESLRNSFSDDRIRTAIETLQAFQNSLST